MRFFSPLSINKLLKKHAVKIAGVLSNRFQKAENMGKTRETKNKRKPAEKIPRRLSESLWGIALLFLSERIGNALQQRTVLIGSSHRILERLHIQLFAQKIGSYGMCCTVDAQGGLAVFAKALQT